MAFELSTAGIKFYCLLAPPSETPPTGTFNLIPSIKSVPDFDDAPELLQSTDLAQLEYHTYVPGLRGLNEPYSMTANLTNDVVNFWKNIVTSYEAVNTTQRLWITCVIPGLDNAPYLYGVPFNFGIPPMEVDTVLEITLSVIPEKIIGWFPKINPDSTFTNNAAITSLTNQNSIYTQGTAISGSASTGATVSLFVDGNIIDPTDIAASNTFSITPTTAIPTGVHYLSIKQTLNGNSSDLTTPLLIDSVSA